jgi:NADH-quinone oxidoreductase subunit C
MSLKWLSNHGPLNLTRSPAWGHGQTAVVLLSREKLLPMAQGLKDRGFFLEFMTAMDVEEGFLLTYLFATLNDAEKVVVRIMIEHEPPEIASLSSIHSGANWHERECHDLYGVIFYDHPHLAPLLLPAEMTLRPLRKTDKTRKAARFILPQEQLIPASPAIQNRCQNSNPVTGSHPVCQAVRTDSLQQG